MTNTPCHTDFQALSLHRATPLTSFLKVRLVIAPAFCARPLRANGFAISAFRWILISPELLTAPEEARRFLLAHEWGHLRQTHSFKMLPPFLVALFAFLTQSPFLILLALCITIGYTAWAISEKREWEADRESAEWIGVEPAIKGLDWLFRTKAGQMTGRRKRRRTALQLTLAPARETAPS